MTCPCATALSCACTHPCTNICARMHAHMCVGGRRTLWMPNSWVLQCRDGSRPIKRQPLPPLYTENTVLIVYHACTFDSFSSACLPQAPATARFDPSRPTILIYYSFCILLSFRAATTSSWTAWLAERVFHCARALGFNFYTKSIN